MNILEHVFAAIGVLVVGFFALCFLAAHSHHRAQRKQANKGKHYGY